MHPFKPFPSIPLNIRRQNVLIELHFRNSCTSDLRPHDTTYTAGRPDESSGQGSNAATNARGLSTEQENSAAAEPSGTKKCIAEQSGTDPNVTRGDTEESRPENGWESAAPVSDVDGTEGTNSTSDTGPKGNVEPNGRIEPPGHQGHNRHQGHTNQDGSQGPAAVPSRIRGNGSSGATGLFWMALGNFKNGGMGKFGCP